MNRKSFAIIFFCAILFIGSAVMASAQSVSLSGSVASVKRGGSARGTVTMNIPGGLHVNSSRPGSEYAIATSVKISATGAKIGGVSYPRGKSRKFTFSDETLNVYEGRTTFSFNVTVPASFKGNTVSIKATVRYQACTNEVCYPPTSKTVNLTAQVK
jgi:DsbC/DsbD-like thiol-disulfide interchange protein